MPRVTITVPEKTPQPYRFPLDRLSVTLGRGSDNDIAIDCRSVSARHAEMCRVEGGYELRDLGSTNGIKLNDDRREVIALRNGLAVKLGDVSFDFMLSDEEIEALARERQQVSATPVNPKAEGPQPPAPAVKDDESFARAMSAPVSGEHHGTPLGIILLLIMLGVAAFFGGMAIRFKKETGESLAHAIRAKFNTRIIQIQVPQQTPDATPSSEPAKPAESAPPPR